MVPLSYRCPILVLKLRALALNSAQLQLLPDVARCDMSVCCCLVILTCHRQYGDASGLACRPGLASAAVAKLHVLVSARWGCSCCTTQSGVA